MTTCNGREALRGAEAETFDVTAQVFTSKQWAQLLNAPLEHALSQGNRGLAQKLVRAGAAAAEAPRAAVQHGHEDIVDHLLGCGASLAAQAGKTLLHHAVEDDNTEVVQFLLLREVDKDARDDTGCTPLYLAACSSHVAGALALLAAGADPNLRCGPREKSALHKAASGGHVDILRAAIEHGADVNMKDKWGVSPFHEALESNEGQVIDVLVEAGADIEPWAVHLAAYYRTVESLVALVKYGFDVNVKDEQEQTPLHCAVLDLGEGTAEIVDLLLRSGADETVPNGEGMRAADIVGTIFCGPEEHRLAEDVEHVRKLLASAPADRAWRRRGYLVLCRAHPDRVQQGQESSSVGEERGICRDAELTRVDERSGDNGIAGDRAAKTRADANWVHVVASVLEVQEEGMFRAIVEYL